MLHGKHDTLVPVDQARLFVEKLRRISKRTVVYAELPGAQHAFDVFPSIRSAHVVRAIDRYLHWHWNTWRAGDRSQEPVAGEGAADAACVGVSGPGRSAAVASAVAGCGDDPGGRAADDPASSATRHTECSLRRRPGRFPT